MDQQISFIGKWVMRISGRLASPGADVGKAHLVESEITDRLVTKCGRELRLVTPHGHLREFVARRLESRCLQCRGQDA